MSRDTDNYVTLSGKTGIAFAMIVASIAGFSVAYFVTRPAIKATPEAIQKAEQERLARAVPAQSRFVYFTDDRGNCYSGLIDLRYGQVMAYTYIPCQP